MSTPPTERVTDYLTEDHARLGELLRAARAGETLDAGAYDRFRRGLLRHMAIEDKLLFPAVRAAQDGRPLARALELRIAHAAIAALLAPTPDLALCGELAGLLEQHDGDEEGPDGAYAECERVLGAARSAELAAQARGFREIRVAPYWDAPASKRTAEAALASARRWHDPGRRPPS